MAYAIRLCARWCGGGITGRARELAAELVQESITRLLEGRRPWNPKQVSLEGHLCGVIRSLVSNEATSADAHLRATDDLAKAAEDGAAQTFGQPLTPEDFYLSKEACAEIEADAYEAAGSDPILAQLVEALADGAGTADEISTATGLTTKQIYLAKDKLKKRHKSILKKRTI
ncbi:sigma-70 family RNA polymerase sigma factor [Myxococcus sp. CA056]|uniref:hypothetical protein n=1 Tax=Myxococcus sp. CA056 TaxID=2741740 RepID=UPI001C2D35A3|nr:hypothetical protein [Myxococcus sp. CA056]NTX09272.1 sigma-70 family RNA polymerase sigma factor [Myxococcus sp. CA056]